MAPYRFQLGPLVGGAGVVDYKTVQPEFGRHRSDLFRGGTVQPDSRHAVSFVQMLVRLIATRSHSQRNGLHALGVGDDRICVDHG